MTNRSKRVERVGRWYDGSVASAGAACFTHPLDLLKVHLQTTENVKIGMVRRAVGIFRSQGVLAIYNGISASLLRQLLLNTRFTIYERSKENASPNGESIRFTKRVALAAFAGLIGGFVCNPCEVVNVRMQNDVKLQPERRRNYNHVIDGLIRVVREEGPGKLYNGAQWAISRCVFVSIGQMPFYDVVKQSLLGTGYFQDNTKTHLLSSLTAGAVATTFTMPLDVCKTRAMNAKPGEFKGAFDVIRFTFRQGPMAFFRGYVPAFVRLGPHTIITFIGIEQLKNRFGHVREY